MPDRPVGLRQEYVAQYHRRAWPTPSTGRVTIDGQEVRGPSPQKVAYVFQENTLFPWRTVIDNVKLGMAFQGVAKAERNSAHGSRSRPSASPTSPIITRHSFRAA